ncbi:MAG TPA: GDSL-type esterase/lipase family protein, partial [Nocardioides sp.]|nr:GDSL-type esterase/lipase family protein [Nocardioides sp.]
GGHSYRDPAFDDDHASMFGMRFSTGQYQLADLAPAYHPDVVIAMIGGNDLVVQISPDVLEAKWRKDVARLRATNRNVSLVLVPLPQTWIPGVTEYNKRLARIATGLDSTRSRVVLADLAVFDALTDTHDHAHFTAAGERKIASVVSAALARIGVGSGVTSYVDPAIGLTGWAPTPRATAGGTSVTISWDPVTYASTQSIYVRNLTTGWTGVLHGVKGTTTTLPGQPGASYRIWLAPAKGYVALGTFSTPVDVTVPAG